ncbi:stage V sporulation protein G [Hydrogenoanaerobacterium saccharovorans]|uniref:Stage V sporulation protein G n=1 Tax=Hydrogenoanaerobacterium saccharovorans TaxID=474960 RepID=A0A1H8CWN1_9FIRM|nr:septation protein SpoVG family protein [Hydrogenoanaerobacterium saccharovorans]RPF43361.1 stage V sporulation protein G [Hydrogenoanaerobacterium saccharovorans]SEM99523.1 stage V sporulation protein G [Hydrogenoanaerobacterium saccharovorans]
MNIKVYSMHLCSSPLVKAIAAITINGKFAVNSIKVVQLDERLIVQMPSIENKQGIHHDLIHPVNEETRKQLEEVILTEYKNKTSGGKQNEQL